jgi:hypothetical protein
MALLITVDGDKTELKDAELSTLQEAVDGFIEVISFPGFDIIVDEEGMLKSKSINQAGSILAGQVVVGDIVVCRTGEIK